MTDDTTHTDDGITNSQSARTRSGSPQFAPPEVARLLETWVANVSNRHVGAFVGMAYNRLSDVLFLGLWAGSVYLFSYSLDFVNYSRNLALITITIGTFVLLAGANLVDTVGEQAVDLRAYIHNSITFIASGIAFLLGFVTRQIVENYTFEPPLAMVAEGFLLSLNIVASFLLLISVWVLLKLLWRLERLISHEAASQDGPAVYGEFRDSIERLSADPPPETDIASGRSTAVGLLWTGTGVLVLGVGPYLATGEWRWSIVALGFGYAINAAIRVRRGEL